MEKNKFVESFNTKAVKIKESLYQIEDIISELNLITPPDYYGELYNLQKAFDELNTTYYETYQKINA